MGIHQGLGYIREALLPAKHRSNGVCVCWGIDPLVHSSTWRGNEWEFTPASITAACQDSLLILWETMGFKLDCDTYNTMQLVVKVTPLRLMLFFLIPVPVYPRSYLAATYLPP